MTTRILHFVMIALVTACSSSEPTLRYAVPTVDAGARIGVSVSTVEVRAITLPSYASDEEIFIETAEGALVSNPDLLWADEPSRAMSLNLSRTLSEITRARVAGEPWPFEERPNAQIDVRVEEMVAGNTGEFRLSGQYFVTSPSGEGREHSHRFEITTPYSTEGGAQSIALARATAVRDLAREIANEGL